MKKLHLAATLDELDNLAAIPNLSKKPALQIANSAAKLLKEANFQYKMGNEEQAYIFFMKFFKLCSLLNKASGYEQNKIQIKQTIGGNEQLSGYMDILGHLKSSLLERYRNIHTGGTNGSSIIPPKDENKGDMENEELSDKSVSTITATKYIGCQELYQTMRAQDTEILLLDCRPGREFEESRIDFQSIINIPSEIIRNGRSAAQLKKGMNERSLQLWNRRDRMNCIVLIDWNTSKKHMDESKPISVLRNILARWDPHTEYKTKPRILDGGYEQFLISYPMLTTNPKFKISSNEFSNYVTLSDIEYPDPSGIKMKPKSIDNAFSGPKIDRSNKSLAERKFFETRKPSSSVELVKEKEMKLDLVLRKEHEVLNLENELKIILNSEDAVNDPGKTKQWFEKQTEIENKLVQKEHELNDTVMELESVEPPFENKLEDLQIEASQQPALKEAMASLEAKRIERTALERDRIENNQFIETKRRQFNEQKKRQLQIDEEEHIRPKVPTFDRSVKPTAQRPYIQRNFSPVHGSYGDIGATGLKNLGNTCYMNSIIQCLLNIEQLCEYLKQNHYQRDLNRKSKTQGKITEELAEVCKQLWSGKCKSISPRNLRYAIGEYQKMFSGYDQQDSHEFLTILIDMLHSELQIPMDQDPDERLSLSEKSWREFVKNKESIIQDLFFGQIRSTLKCRTCQMESPTYEGFSNLSLELPNDNRQCHLYDCLDLYFNGEIISGWTCPKCKVSREAVKKLDISKLPQILVIHLKRFHFNLQSLSTTYQKKQNSVRFPIEDFNISDYITRSVKSRKESFHYDLCAVSNHYGTMERGHYTAYCKNYRTKCWYKFDDNYVSPTSASDVNTSAAYILFYMRN